MSLISLKTNVIQVQSPKSRWDKRGWCCKVYDGVVYLQTVWSYLNLWVDWKVKC